MAHCDLLSSICTFNGFVPINTIIHYMTSWRLVQPFSLTLLFYLLCIATFFPHYQVLRHSHAHCVW